MFRAAENRDYREIAVSNTTGTEMMGMTHVAEREGLLRLLLHHELIAHHGYATVAAECAARAVEEFTIFGIEIR